MSQTSSDEGYNDDFEDFTNQRDPLASWQSSKSYSLRRVIGRGSYGEVVEAMDTRTKEPVAIKRVQDIIDSILDAKRIYREIHILR
jgi:serine/threonine protein kinase